MLDSDRKYKGEAHMETYKYEKIRNVAVLVHIGHKKDARYLVFLA